MTIDQRIFVGLNGDALALNRSNHVGWVERQRRPNAMERTTIINVSGLRFA